MIEHSVELELEAIRQHLTALSRQARSGPEEPGLVEVLGRLAAALDGLQQLAEDLRVQNEDLLTTRQAVEEERQRYLALFVFAPDGYLVTDLEGVIREANHAAAALFQVRQEFLAGKPLVTFVAPEEKPAFFARLGGLSAERGARRWEVTLQPRAGEQIHASINVAVVSATSSAPVGLHWMIRDISERKRMEARFHATVEAAPTAMLMVDSAGSIVLVNAEAERLFGYARHELLGQRVEVLVPERSRGEHPRLRSQFLAAPEARRMGAGRDLFGLRKDGSEFPVEIGLSPIEMEEGLFVLSAIVDITERKRMENTLRRQHQWDAALVTIGQAATALLPFEEILTKGLEAMLQASGATLGLVRLVDPETRDLVMMAHRGVPPEYLDGARRIPWGEKPAGFVAATGEAWLARRVHPPEVSHLGRLAEAIQSLVCLPLVADGRVVGTLMLGHVQPDFFGTTDLELLLPAISMLAGAIRAEQLRAAITKEAEERALLFRELDHRVRNNLAALISLLHLGAEGTEGATAERLREMADRVARLAEVHNLLTGREMQPIEIRDLAQVIAKDILTVLPGRVHIGWRVTGEPVRVPPSRVTAIALILNELLTNCAKHAFPGRATGTVYIQVALDDGDHVVLEVQDDGVGLDPGRHQGGLGMTIIQTLVTQSLRGTLRFARRGGTLVTIRFPHVEETGKGGTS